jgi:hypothetical protein
MEKWSLGPCRREIGGHFLKGKKIFKEENGAKFKPQIGPKNTVN